MNKYFYLAGGLAVEIKLKYTPGAYSICFQKGESTPESTEFTSVFGWPYQSVIWTPTLRRTAKKDQAIREQIHREIDTRTGRAWELFVDFANLYKITLPELQTV